MQFQTVKTALAALLAANAASLGYSIVGYQAQSHGAEEIANYQRHVEVYYGSGTFPRDKSSIVGPFAHEVTYKVSLIISGTARADLSVLESPTATDAQRASALEASLAAADFADRLWDDLAAKVWNLLMMPANRSLGLDTGVVSDRYISNLKKNSPSRQGSFVILDGTMDYTCRVIETPTGETPVPGTTIEAGIILTSDKTGTVLDSALQGVEVVQ